MPTFTVGYIEQASVCTSLSRLGEPAVFSSVLMHGAVDQATLCRKEDAVVSLISRMPKVYEAAQEVAPKGLFASQHILESALYSYRELLRREDPFAMQIRARCALVAVVAPWVALGVTR